MAPLPSYRLDVAPPFTDTGVDLFGPVSVKSGRYGKKVWVVLFCCLRIRAVFMDVVSDIEAQTFIEVLKRFHSFYPSVRRLHSDQGTNLIGADNMLKKMLAEWKNSPPSQENPVPLGIDWHFIPPHAPHQGGSWESLVGVVKKVIDGLASGELHYERFRTVVQVAAGIVNRRPLTRFSADPQDLRPLTPAHFLNPAMSSLVLSSDVLPAVPLTGTELRRSKDVLRPILDSLWKQWRNEYIASLQKRSKWISRQRNIQKGDLVLLIEESLPRERWPLAIVTNAIPSEDGLVRRIVLRTSSNRSLERDVRKIVLLEREGEDQKVEEVVVDVGGAK